MTSNAYSDLETTTLSDRLDDKHEILAAVGDVLGSVALDELADDTPRQLGMLVFRAAREANELSEELWRRFHRAKVALGEYQELDEPGADA